jgi:hypothetical protein
VVSYFLRYFSSTSTELPVLKNPRRQRFAQLLASSKTAKDAYEIAG